MGKKQATTSTSSNKHNNNNNGPSSSASSISATTALVASGSNPMNITDMNVESIVSFFDFFEDQQQELSSIPKQATSKQIERKKVQKYDMITEFSLKIDPIMMYILENRDLFTNDIRISKRLQRVLFPLLTRLQKDALPQTIVLSLLVILFTISTDAVIPATKLPSYGGITLPLLLLEFYCRGGKFEGDFFIPEDTTTGTPFNKSLHTILQLVIVWIDEIEITIFNLPDKDVFIRYLRVIEYLSYVEENILSLRSLIEIFFRWYVNYDVVVLAVNETSFIFTILWKLLAKCVTEMKMEIWRDCGQDTVLFLKTIGILSNTSQSPVIKACCNHDNLVHLVFTTFSNYIDKWSFLVEDTMVESFKTNDERIMYSTLLLRLSLQFHRLCQYKEFKVKLSQIHQSNDLDISNWLTRLVEYMLSIQTFAIHEDYKHDCYTACFLIMDFVMLIAPSCQPLVSDNKELFVFLLEKMKATMYLLQHGKKNPWYDINRGNDLPTVLAYIIGMLNAFTVDLLQVPDWTSLLISVLDISTTHALPRGALCRLFFNIFNNHSTNEVVVSKFMPLLQSKIDVPILVIKDERCNEYALEYCLRLVAILVQHSNCDIMVTDASAEKLVHFLLSDAEQIASRFLFLLVPLFDIVQAFVNLVIKRSGRFTVNMSFFARTFINLSQINLSVELFQVIVNVTTQLQNHCDSMCTAFYKIPNLLKEISKMVTIYITQETVLEKLFTLLLIDNVSIPFNSFISTDVFMNVLIEYRHRDEAGKLYEIAFHALERCFNETTGVELLKRKQFWTLSTNAMIRFYRTNEVLFQRICETLLKVAESEEDTSKVMELVDCFDICMNILQASHLFKRETTFAAIRLLKEFSNFDKVASYPNYVNLMMKLLKQYITTEFPIAAHLLGYLCVIVGASKSIANALRLEIPYFCDLIMNNITNEVLVKTSLMLVNDTFFEGSNVPDPKHIPSCYSKMMLFVMQSPIGETIDIATAMILALSWWLNSTTLDRIFPKTTCYVEYIVKVFPVVVRESDDGVAGICHILAAVLEEPRYRGIASIYDFVANLIKIMPLPQEDDEHLDEWISCCCHILLYLNEQEYDKAHAVRQWILKDASRRTVLIIRILAYMRHYKKDASMVELICNLLTGLEMDSSDALHFTNANGFCDLLVQSIRYHLESSDVVRVICATLQMLMRGDPAIKIKFGKVANCFDIVISITKHYHAIGDISMVEESFSLLTTQIVDSTESVKRFLGIGTSTKPVDTLLAMVEPPVGAIIKQLYTKLDDMVVALFIEAILPGVTTLMPSLQNANDLCVVLTALTDLARIYHKHPSFAVSKVCEIVVMAMRDEKQLTLCKATATKLNCFGSCWMLLLRAHSSNETVASLVCEGIWRMLSGPKNNKTIIYLFNSYDTSYQALTTALELQYDLCKEATTVHHICQALIEFARNDDSVKVILRNNESFHELLRKVVLRNGSNENVRATLLQLHALLNIPMLEGDTQTLDVMEWLKTEIASLVSANNQSKVSRSTASSALWVMVYRKVKSQYREKDLLQFANMPNLGKGLIKAIKQKLSAAKVNSASMEAILHLLHLVIQYCNDLAFTAELSALVGMLLDNCWEHSTRVNVIRLIPFIYFYNTNICNDDMNSWIFDCFQLAYKVPDMIPSVLLSIESPVALMKTQETLYYELLFHQIETEKVSFWSHITLQHLQDKNVSLLEHDFIILHYSLKGFDLDTFLRNDIVTSKNNKGSNKQLKWDNKKYFVAIMEKEIIPFITNHISQLNVAANEVIAEHICGVLYWLQIKWSHHVTIPISLWKIVSELMELHIDNMSLVEMGCGFLSSIAQRWKVPKDCSMFIGFSWKVVMLVMNEYVYDEVIFHEVIQVMESMIIELMKSDVDGNPFPRSLIPLQHCQEAFVALSTLCCKCAVDIPLATLQCMFRMMLQLERHLLANRTSLLDSTLQSTSSLVTLCNVYVMKRHGIVVFQFITHLINSTASEKIEDVINMEALIQSNKAIKQLMHIVHKEVFAVNGSHASDDVARFVKLLRRLIISKKELSLLFGQDGKLCELIIRAFHQQNLLQDKLLCVELLHLLLLLSEENSNLQLLQSMENSFEGLNMLLETLNYSEDGKQVSCKLYALMSKLVSKDNVNTQSRSKRLLELIIRQVVPTTSSGDSYATERMDPQLLCNGMQFLHNITSTKDLMSNLSRNELMLYCQFMVRCIQLVNSVKDVTKNPQMLIEQIDDIVWTLYPLLMKSHEAQSKRSLLFVVSDLDTLESDQVNDNVVHVEQDVRTSNVEDHFIQQDLQDINFNVVIAWTMSSITRQISSISAPNALNGLSCIKTLHQLLKWMYSSKTIDVTLTVCNDITIECIAMLLTYAVHHIDTSHLTIVLEVVDMLSSKWLLATNVHCQALSSTSLDHLHTIVATSVDPLKRLHNEANDANNIVLLTQVCRVLSNVVHVVKQSPVGSIPIEIDTTICFKLLRKYHDNVKGVLTISSLFTSSLFASNQQPSALNVLLPNAWLPCLLSIIECNQMTPSVVSALFHVINCILQTKAQSETYRQTLVKSMELLMEILQSYQFNSDVISALCPILIYALTRSNDNPSTEVNDHYRDSLRVLLTETETYFVQQGTAMSIQQDLLTTIRELLLLLPNDGNESSNVVEEAVSSETHDKVMQSVATSILATDLEIVQVVDANVLKGTWKGCMNVVVKLLKHDSESIKLHNELVSVTPKHTYATSYQIEKDLLASIRHPKIISLIGISSSVSLSQSPAVSASFKNEQCGGIVLEYLEKGDLRKLLNEEHASLSLQCKLRIALDMCEGMRFLHASNVIHGDLQSMNVLIDSQYRAKISGFGCERVRQMIKAPMKFDANNAVNRSRDVYDFAVIVWEMETGKVAWTEKVSKQAKLTLTAKEAKACSYGVSKLLDSCMVESSDVMKRPSFAELYEIIHELLVKETKRIEDKAREVPDGMLCPITQDIMKDPVILGAEGHSYERSEIVKWLKKNTRSPLTGAELSESERTNLIDNYALKSAIESFLLKQQEKL